LQFVCKQQKGKCLCCVVPDAPIAFIPRLLFSIGACKNSKGFAASSSAGETPDADTGKAHCFKHLLINTVEHRDPMQHNSGKGEGHLKEWAKAISATAQNLGLDTFLFQTMLRVADRLVLSRASDAVKRQTFNKRQRKKTRKEESPKGISDHNKEWHHPIYEK
jgi:hypothetical protein